MKKIQKLAGSRNSERQKGEYFKEKRSVRLPQANLEAMKSITKALIEPYFWMDKERMKNIHKFDTREHPRGLLAKVKSKHLGKDILQK